MVKKNQTAKYRKRHKKDVANRKAKQLVTQQEVTIHKPSAIGTSPDILERLSKAEPVSPARRAFQDV